MATAQRILSELKQGFALSDQDLAGRLDLPEPSVRRTRLNLYRARKIEYGGRSCGQDAWALKKEWA